VGFIIAISNGIISAYIPLLEVLPSYRGSGLAKRLTKLMLDSLAHVHMIDLLCDKDIMLFYEKLNMKAANGMTFRNYNILKTL